MTPNVSGNSSTKCNFFLLQLPNCLWNHTCWKKLRLKSHFKYKVNSDQAVFRDANVQRSYIKDHDEKHKLTSTNWSNEKWLVNEAIVSMNHVCNGFMQAR